MKPEIIKYKVGVEEVDEKDAEGKLTGAKKKVDILAEVSMNFPEDLDEMAQMWGGDTAYDKAKAQVVIDARRLCYEASTVEEAQEMVNQFTPGVSRRATGGTSNKALMAQLSELRKVNPEKYAEIEAMMKASK